MLPVLAGGLTGAAASSGGAGIMAGLSGAAAGASNIGNAVGGIGSMFSGISSLFGKRKNVSAPPPPTGAQSGQWAKDYYDYAFPGTTPWERLGTSNPSGQVASTTMETNNQARVHNSERKFQYDNMKIDTMSKMMDLQLKKSQVDIARQEVGIREKEYQLKDYLKDSERYRNENSGFVGGVKTSIKEYPWLLGLLGLSGAAKGAGVAANAFKTFQQGRQAAKALKDGRKYVNQNTINAVNKANRKSFKKGYTNPYSGKKIPD